MLHFARICSGHISICLCRNLPKTVQGKTCSTWEPLSKWHPCSPELCPQQPAASLFLSYLPVCIFKVLPNGLSSKLQSHFLKPPPPIKKVGKKNKSREGVCEFSRALYHHSGHFRYDQVSNISLCTWQHITGLARQWHHFCNKIQQKLIFRNSIRAKYHKLTAIDTEELLIYKIIFFFNLRELENCLCRCSYHLPWVNTFRFGMLLGGKYLCKIFIDHNKLNGSGRAELIVLYLAPPFFPGDGGRCRVF